MSCIQTEDFGYGILTCSNTAVEGFQYCKHCLTKIHRKYEKKIKGVHSKKYKKEIKSRIDELSDVLPENLVANDDIKQLDY